MHGAFHSFRLTEFILRLFITNHTSSFGAWSSSVQTSVTPAGKTHTSSRARRDSSQLRDSELQSSVLPKVEGIEARVVHKELSSFSRDTVKFS